MKPAAQPSLYAQLDTQRAMLDTLMADVDIGIRGARHFDQLEEHAQAIANGIIAAFRSAR